jgi:hypothetical protein
MGVVMTACFSPGFDPKSHFRQVFIDPNTLTPE